MNGARLLAVAMVAVASAGAVGVGAPNTHSDGTASLTAYLVGTVQDTAGEPVGGTTVDVVDLDTGDHVATVATDANGTFGPLVVDPGTYVAELNDTAASESATRVRTDPDEVERIHVVAGSPSEQLLGTVQDPAGESVGGTAVDVVDLDTGDRVATVESDADGTFGPLAVAPGNYTAELNDTSTDETANRVRLQRDEAEALHVVAGSPTEMLTGYVQDTGGTPIAGFAIDVVDIDTGDRLPTVETDADGTFGPLAVDPGSYVAELNSSEFDAASGDFATKVTVQVDESERIEVVVNRTTDTPTATASPTPTASTTPTSTRSPSPTPATTTRSTPTPSTTPVRSPTETATPSHSPRGPEPDTGTPGPATEDSPAAEGLTPGADETATPTDGAAPGAGIILTVLALIAGGVLFRRP